MVGSAARPFEWADRLQRSRARLWQGARGSATLWWLGPRATRKDSGGSGSAARCSNGPRRPASEEDVRALRAQPSSEQYNRSARCASEPVCPCRAGWRQLATQRPTDAVVSNRPWRPPRVKQYSRGITSSSAAACLVWVHTPMALQSFCSRSPAADLRISDCFSGSGIAPPARRCNTRLRRVKQAQVSLIPDDPPPHPAARS